MKTYGLVFLASVASLTGCNKLALENEGVNKRVDSLAKEEANLSDQITAATTISNSDVLIPRAYRFKESLQVGQHETWDGLIDSIPKEDAKYLNSINSNYFGALSFKSKDELRELAAKGFPLPEEWLEARSMTDEELKKLSNSGNLKAKAFYLDRLISRADEYFDLRGVDDVAYQASPGAKYSLQAYELAAQIQSSYKSAFGGYLLGSAYSRLNFPQSPEAGAAGMFVALNAGDKRALGLLRTYEATHPDMNIGEIMSAYGALR